jgi:hypothetical protein
MGQGQKQQRAGEDKGKVGSDSSRWTVKLGGVPSQQLAESSEGKSRQ